MGDFNVAAGDYDVARSVVEPGKPLSKCIPRENYRAIILALDVHQALKVSYDRLEDKSDLRPEDIEFRGWDGNIELLEVVYTRYLVANEQFKNILTSRSCPNFSGPGTQGLRYRAMVAAWERIIQNRERPDRFVLSADEMKQVIAAGS